MEKSKARLILEAISEENFSYKSEVRKIVEKMISDFDFEDIYDRLLMQGFIFENGRGMVKRVRSW